jgi:hypothetical protein
VTVGSFLAGVLWAYLQLVLRWALFLAGRVGLFSLWLFWPVWFLALAAGWLVTSAQTAEAGWFSWLWGDSGRATQQVIERLETANRALQSAAEVVNEASRFQAGQNVQVLSAIQALSGERTELAGSLERLAGLAAQDSQWAAAVHVAAPIFLAASVLVVAALALWITHKSQPDDADVLGTLLIEELATKASQREPARFGVGPPGTPAESPARRPVSRLPHRPFRESGFRHQPLTPTPEQEYPPF